MHAYRDAIVNAESAWILYPGQEFHYFARNSLSTPDIDPLAAPLVGVGAIPLNPLDHNKTYLRAVLGRILGVAPGSFFSLDTLNHCMIDMQLRATSLRVLVRVLDDGFAGENVPSQWETRIRRL